MTRENIGQTDIPYYLADLLNIDRTKSTLMEIWYLDNGDVVVAFRRPADQTRVKIKYRPPT